VPDDDGYRIALKDGHAIRARQAVLALGNGPPALPPGLKVAA
jgi:hypothetical protein